MEACVEIPHFFFKEWCIMGHMSAVVQFLNNLMFLSRASLHGWAWGRSTCRTGAGRTPHPSQTPACDGCQGNRVTLAFVPTWREPRWRVSKPTPAPPQPTVWSAKNLPVREPTSQIQVFSDHLRCEKTRLLLIIEFFICVPQEGRRVLALVPVRRPAPSAAAAPTAPARPWSACGVAALSAAWTPQRTSSPFPTASVWSGRPRTALVSVFFFF